VKIAFLIERFDPRRGGMETSASEFLIEIRALGLDAHVITAQAGSHDGSIPVQDLGRHGWSRSRAYRSFVERCETFLSQGTWDVVHAITPCHRCHLYQPRAGLAREALARTIAVRSNTWARLLRRLGAALDAKQRLLARLERELLTGPGAPLVAALSGYMRRQLETAYKLPANRIREVLNGVAVPPPAPGEQAACRARLRQELGLGADDPVAIFVGHNFRRKGLLRLLEALLEPEAQSWHLLVAGKDHNRSCARFVNDHALGQRVRFLGARTDVRALYLAADVAVLPTYYDPCSRTVLEALSLGLPCVTTRFDGSSDAITDGQNGFVIEAPEAVGQIAAALGQLNQPDVRRVFSRHAINVRDHVSMKRHARDIASIYEELCRRPPPSEPLQFHHAQPDPTG
jgi:UDP-glucose:(heptosyl)LPS alpha-1,3-glucosyltransferase